MPELPEVEVVRRGLSRWVAGRPIASVTVVDPRCLRRHVEGPGHFAAELAGRTPVAARRRGKYLWLPLDEDRPGEDAIVAHLGMSGQLLVQPADHADEPHLRARIRFGDSGRELRFVDQRTFGGLAIDTLVDDGTGGAVPKSVAHIARDPMDEAFDPQAAAAVIRGRRSGIKRVLLDQGVMSGIGNIYADESLWRARLHYDYPATGLTRARALALIEASQEVMAEALAQGGTSFDSLYVNVNGESGYFSRHLDAYGREGEPCARCAAIIVREPFMNRSSYRCPRCQRRPRAPRR